MSRRRRSDYSEALDSVKRWAGQTRPADWTDEEWRMLVRKATAQKPDAASPIRPGWAVLRPLATAAASLAVLVWAVVFLSNPRPRTVPVQRLAENRDTVPIAPPPPPSSETPSVRTVAAISADRTLSASAAGAPRPTADKPAFTWISPDTGLQIVWFTNNNLNLEDHQ